MKIKELLEDNGYGERGSEELLREDLGMDSMDMAGMGIELDIEDREWEKILTVGDLELRIDKE